MKKILLLILAFLPGGPLQAAPLEFPARSRIAGTEGVEVKVQTLKWEPAETAFIICDFWDTHTCQNAAKRVDQMAPRLAEVVGMARKLGVLIIHAPSDCMKFYEGTAARLRAQEAPAVAAPPKDISKWQYWKSEEEEKAGYPVDATDGGSDDEPAAHEAWLKQLASEGRDAKLPWRREHPAISLDETKDAVSDKGAEIWNLLEARGIKNVFIAGVHANMCVCGRSFGLRQLSRLGKQVVLLRDLTDAMYNPAMPPMVSHFRGTEMIVGHIERYVSPTVMSAEVFGGVNFRFAEDRRPHLVMMIGEDEYRTAATLPTFAEQELGKNYRLSYVLAPEVAPADFAGIDAIKSADALLLSCRRRLLPAAQLAVIQQYAASGKPILGIRTASHSFAPKKGEAVPEGRAAWPEFDQEILGGNYQNHHGNTAKTTAQISISEGHPILAGIAKDAFQTGGSLYKNTPLQKGAQVLLMGRAEGIEQPEPVAWTNVTTFGGRVFYTSLGHSADFQSSAFRKLLINALQWSLEPRAK